MTSGTLVIPSGRRLYVDDHATLTLNAGVICQATGAELIVRPCGRYNNNAGCNIRGETGCLMVEGVYQLGDGLTQQFLDDGFLALNGGQIILGQGSSIVIENSGNSRMEVRQNSTVSYGNGSYIVVNGRVDVWSNAQLYISPNGVVYANGGSLFSMGAGTSISTEGKFHAVGTASNNIQFTSTSGWYGITAKSGNNSGVLGDIRLEHVTFSNAIKPLHIETPITAVVQNVVLNSPSIGIEIVPNYNITWEPPPPPTMQLNAVTINNAGTYGITVENFSDLSIGACSISGYQAFAGIALTNSSPKILETTVQDFEVGVYGLANSAPLLFDQGIGGYNVFTSNITGAQFEGNSNAALGIDDGVGGQNAFTQSYGYAIALLDNSIVHSEWNWYGTPSPTQNLFSITGGSKLYWEPYLTSPPGGNGATSSIAGKEEVEDPGLTPTDPRMKQVLRLRVQNRSVEAATLLRTIVVDQGASMQLKRWALGQLLAVSQSIRNPNLAAYLNALRSTLPQVRQYLAELLPGACMHERSVRNALDWYDDNIRNHANSITEAQALYGKFSHALFGAGDRTEAQSLLSNLQNRYARTGQTKLALAQWNATPTSSPVNSGLAKNGTPQGGTALENTNAKPSVFALHQNYPNPFNPTTTIRYQLPTESRISLNVYDLLGREVAMLADEVQGSGFKSVEFDASQLASGVYIYRLAAGSFSASRKLIVLK